jgi:hypothetical protein
MWLKSRRTNALLEPLAPVVEGSVSDRRLNGSYCGYGVEARPHSGYPIDYLSVQSAGAVEPKPVNMLRVTLVGVAGTQVWHCQSSAGSYAQDVTSRFTAGPLLEHFKPGAFKFTGVDTLHEAVERMGEKLTERLGMPIGANADPALQERLIAAGLFEELDALRLGGHPYLPKVQYMPGARALADQMYVQSGRLERMQAVAQERLRAAGMSGDVKSMFQAKIDEADAKSPGRLELDVETRKPQVPTAEQFRHVLEHALRIAKINADVNHLGTPG